MTTPDSARYRISFPTFRANQSGPESWQALTTETFLRDIDQHLDTLLNEYVVMIAVAIELMKTIDKDDTFTAKQVAERIRGTFPFAELGSIVTDRRHNIVYPDEIIYADEQFKGWRDLDREAILELCREHYGALIVEHEHLSATLARTHNRIEDHIGWSHWRAKDIRAHLYSQMMWDWPRHKPTSR